MFVSISWVRCDVSLITPVYFVDRAILTRPSTSAYRIGRDA